MTYSKSQLFFLTALRLFIGWHFFFEGLVKLFNPDWTAKGYLLNSQGFLAPVFKWLANNVVGVTDILTTVGLLVAGLCLMLGVFEKIGAIIGLVLLAFFYLSYPPWPGLESVGPAEGNYWIVNKNLIELAAVGVLAFFPTGHLWGLAMFLKRPAPSAA